MLKIMVMGCTGELNSFINDFLTDRRYEVHRLLSEETKQGREVKMIGADFQYKRSAQTVTIELTTTGGKVVPIELLNDSSLKIEVVQGSVAVSGKSYDIFSPPSIERC